ncbi:MAG: hypothetical protein ICV83_20870, partial [Cytophagales bacterium]|nr:hypothetical protein [Cytophagales bacterium]
VEEVRREKPDFIVHSHLAVWGNLVARHFKLPTVTLFTTFILDRRIMLPEVRKRNAGQGVDFSNISQGKLFYQKLQRLHNRLQLPDQINIWDIYVNKGNLNLSFILEAFQPRPELLGAGYHFVGFPLPVEAAPLPKDVIYVALGTVFNNEVAFYRLCIEVLKDFPHPCVLSVGKKTDRALLGQLPGHIRVEAFTDQVQVLRKTAVFITRGGMASVHEAVHTRTPMIVIPNIPEQQLTAASVEALGIGLRLAAGDLTAAALRAALRQVLDNQAWYAENLRVLLAGKPRLPAVSLAHQLLDDHLQQELRPRRS